MTNPFFIFIIYYVGALTLWSLGGFKGKISDNIPRPYDKSSRKISTLIFGLGMIILLITIVFTLFEYYQSTQPYVIPGLTPEETREVLEKTNGTGEIKLKEEQIDEFINKLDSIKKQEK